MAQVTERVTRVDIGIPTEKCEGIIRILNTLLSDEYVLYTKVKNYHWNVYGKNFNELHEFFGSLYEEIDVIVDKLAERVRFIGGKPYGTLTEFLQNTRLKEHAGQHPESKKMIKNLLADYESIIKYTRSDIETMEHKYKDLGSIEMLTSFLSMHEKTAWMLRSNIEED